MKKSIALILILGIIFGLVGCEKNNNNIDEQAKKTAIENTINGFFADFKKCDFDGAKSYLLGDKNINELDYEKLTNGEKDAIKYWVEKIGYKTKSIVITKDNAQVIIDISTIDGQQIYSDYMDTLLNLKEKYISAKNSKDKEKFAQEYNTALINSIKNKKNEIVTSTVNLELENQNNKWYIVGDENFINSLYGGVNPEKFKN